MSECKHDWERVSKSKQSVWLAGLIHAKMYDYEYYFCTKCCKEMRQKMSEEKKDRTREINQALGFILIIGMILLNTVLCFKGLEGNNIDFLDTFGWGFMNGLVMVIGLLKLGGK